MQLVDFARAHGIVIDRQPPVGVWRRYKTLDKPKHRNGAVKFLGDVAFIQNHATMDEVVVWHREGASTATVAKDLAELRRREARKRREAEHAMRVQFAALPFLRGGHPYLDGKGLTMQGCGALRVDGDLLVIPMYRDGLLVSFQTIAPDGGKKYRAGCSVRGARLELARRRSVLTCLVEGFATGLAVYQALPDATVIVCFDAGNLVHVAPEFAKVPGRVVVCADNDHATAARIGSNPGLEKGAAAAAAIGCGMAYPEGIRGSDWADALREWGERGPARVRSQIMRAVRST